MGFRGIMYAATWAIDEGIICKVFLHVGSLVPLLSTFVVSPAPASGTVATVGMAAVDSRFVWLASILPTLKMVFSVSLLARGRRASLFDVTGNKPVCS
jgi:hypothetical protein